MHFVCVCAAIAIVFRFGIVRGLTPCLYTSLRCQNWPEKWIIPKLTSERGKATIKLNEDFWKQ